LTSDQRIEGADRRPHSFERRAQLAASAPAATFRARWRGPETGA
jgi:hypothetical protein